MIQVDLPGHQPITIKYLVLDLNGTIAVDGILINGVSERILELKSNLEIYLISADTFGTAREIADQLGITLEKMKLGQKESPQKAQYVLQLGRELVAAIGNGANDDLMLKAARIGIAVIGPEGAYSPTAKSAAILTTNILDALDLLRYPKRLTATLRK
jgi:P-type E1-E2 ATPase